MIRLGPRRSAQAVHRRSASRRPTAARPLRIVLEEGFEQGLRPHELSDGIVREAQREIGHLWQKNLIGIADEHMATAISPRPRAALSSARGACPRNGKRVIIACVEGELHELPARLVADSPRHGRLRCPLPRCRRADGRPHPNDRAGPAGLARALGHHELPRLGLARRDQACVRGVKPELPIATEAPPRVVPGLANDVNADITAASANDLVDSTRRLLGSPHEREVPRRFYLDTPAVQVTARVRSASPNGPSLLLRGGGLVVEPASMRSAGLSLSGVSGASCRRPHKRSRPWPARTRRKARSLSIQVLPIEAFVTAGARPRPRSLTPRFGFILYGAGGPLGYVLQVPECRSSSGFRLRFAAHLRALQAGLDDRPSARQRCRGRDGGHR